MLTTALLMILVLSAASTLQADDLLFNFNPSNSVSWAEIDITEHIRSADGKQGLIDSTYAFYQKQFVRSPIGFDMVCTPDSIKSSRNGKPIDSPISDAMARTPYRMVIDDIGHCLSIEGFEKLEGNLIVKDSALAETIRQNLNPAGMASKEIGEWNSLIDPLVGVKVELGPIMYVQESFQLGPDRALELYTLVECTDTFRVDGNLCARVYQHADTDFMRLAQRRGETSEQLLADFGLDSQPSAPEGASVMRVTQIVAEIETLKVLGVGAKTEITMTGADQSGEKHAVSLLETRDVQMFYSR